MATIDPSIALGVRPVQIENPLNQLAALTQIQSGQQGQQLNALKMRQAQQDFDTQNALAEAYKGAFNPNTGSLDYNLLTKQLAERGAGSAIPALLKTQRETQQAEALLGKTNVETQEAKRKLVTGMSRDLSRNPSDANIQAHFEDFASSKLFNPNEIAAAQAKRDQLLAMPIPDRQAYLASQGATAGELKPTIKDTDIGAIFDNIDKILKDTINNADKMNRDTQYKIYYNNDNIIPYFENNKDILFNDDINFSNFKKKMQSYISYIYYYIFFFMFIIFIILHYIYINTNNQLYSYLLILLLIIYYTLLSFNNYFRIFVL